MLGPIQGFRDGVEVDLGGPTQRRLLASLVAQPKQVVSVTTLLGHLWGEDPPPSGPASIQSYVSRLRRSLGPDGIETIAPGYRLGGDLEIDSVRFLEIAVEYLLALGLEPDLVVIVADPALGIPMKTVVALAKAIFELLRLKEREDAIVHLGGASRAGEKRREQPKQAGGDPQREHAPHRAAPMPA